MALPRCNCGAQFCYLCGVEYPKCGLDCQTRPTLPPPPIVPIANGTRLIPPNRQGTPRRQAGTGNNGFVQPPAAAAPRAPVPRVGNDTPIRTPTAATPQTPALRTPIARSNVARTAWAIPGRISEDEQSPWRALATQPNPPIRLRANRTRGATTQAAEPRPTVSTRNLDLAPVPAVAVRPGPPPNGAPSPGVEVPAHPRPPTDRTPRNRTRRGLPTPPPKFQNSRPAVLFPRY